MGLRCFADFDKGLLKSKLHGQSYRPVNSAYSQGLFGDCTSLRNLPAPILIGARRHRWKEGGRNVQRRAAPRPAGINRVSGAHRSVSGSPPFVTPLTLTPPVTIPALVTAALSAHAAAVAHTLFFRRVDNGLLGTASVVRCCRFVVRSLLLSLRIYVLIAPVPCSLSPSQTKYGRAVDLNTRITSAPSFARNPVRYLQHVREKNAESKNIEWEWETRELGHGHRAAAARRAREGLGRDGRPDEPRRLRRR